MLGEEDATAGLGVRKPESEARPGGGAAAAGEDGRGEEGPGGAGEDVRVEEPAAEVSGGTVTDRRAAWLVYGLALLPFVVAAVAVVVTVGGDYLPSGDLAMTEMHIRDVGRHEVLVGLFSRWTWNHPGPLQFYLVAPFYWLTGGSSIGMVLGAFAINAAAVAGMVAVARRRGGTPLALCTVIATGLLVRTVGTEFLGDSWNLTLTVLPCALLVFLTWSALCGDVWALPAAVFVTSFLVQTHVGFVVIAGPLLVLSAGALAARRRRGGQPGPEPSPGGLRPWLASATVLVVVWLPPLVDAVVRQGSNLGDIFRYFRDPDEPPNTLATGWKVVMAQFGPKPEWLTEKLPFNPLTGESPFVGDAPVPVWLALVAVAGIVLWRRSGRDRALVVALAAIAVTCIVSIARTNGIVADYRIRYTWVPPVVAAVAVLWAGWLAVSRRWPRVEARLLVPGAAVAAVAITAANVVGAATAGTPHEEDTAVVRTLVAPVAEEFGDADEPVVVWEPLGAAGPWYSRALVLQLERRGIDVLVDPELGNWFTRSRTYRGGPVAARLVVATDEEVDVVAEDPGMRRIARWTSIPDDERARIEAEIEELDAALDAGEIDRETAALAVLDHNDRLLSVDGVTAHEVAVFVDESTADT